MKVLSLFDGMACGALAMIRAEIPVERYVAFEIDKYAVETSSHNFHTIEHRGDVFGADFTEFEGFDYLIGGSPCTYWSIAQKNNREVEASGMGWELFCQYVRAVCEAKPKFFIYENNKSMSAAIRESITQAFGFEPIMINSALVSAQNRQRLYWVGKRNADGTYSKVDVEQPEDRGILLKDILDGVAERDKGRAVIGSIGRTTTREYFQKHQGTMAFHPVAIGWRGRQENGAWKKRYEAREDEKANAMTTAQTDCMVAEPVGTTRDGKSYCLTAGYANGSGEKIGNYAAHTLEKGCKSMVSEPVRVGCLPSPDGTVKNSQAMRLYSPDGKSVNLTSQGGGLGAKTGLYAISVGNMYEKQGQNGQLFSVYGKSKTLSAGTGVSGRGIGSNNAPKVCIPLDCQTYAEPIEWSENGEPVKAMSYADGKTYIVYKVENGQITIKDKQYPIKLEDGFYIIRKLTVKECMRLQTVPEWYEFPVSDSQAYKMLGNGWTVDVIAHLLTHTKEKEKTDED